MSQSIEPGTLWLSKLFDLYGNCQIQRRVKKGTENEYEYSFAKHNRWYSEAEILRQYNRIQIVLTGPDLEYTGLYECGYNPIPSKNCKTCHWFVCDAPSMCAGKCKRYPEPMSKCGTDWCGEYRNDHNPIYQAQPYQAI